MVTLRKLWTGDLPLETAFWSYAVLGGFVVNAVTSAGFLILILQDQPLGAAMVGYGVSIPYNVVVTVGVWRAAARGHADAGRARVYQLITVVGMLVLSLI